MRKVYDTNELTQSRERFFNGMRLILVDFNGILPTL